jgi:PAS domain S-box-containing protein
MGDGVVVADRESDFQLMNRAARRMLNVNEDSHPDVRAENWTEAFGVRIYRPDQVTPYPHEDLPLIQAINGRAVTRADLYLIHEADQRETWLSVTARPVVDEAGGVHGGVTVWRDSTERKQAERELRDSEALYQSLVENLPMCVVRKDPQGRYVFANREFREWARKSPRDILGRTDFDFYPRSLAAKLHEDDLGVMNSGTLYENVEEHLLLEGPLMYVETRKSVVQDSEGEVVGLQSIFWDVTPRIRAQQDREDMQRKILQSERLAAIGQMVAGVAHESRNALQKIEACTQLLRWRLNGSAAGEEEELINDIQQAQQRLLRLFEDLRGYAAPLRLERKWCDISEVIRTAWENAASPLNGRQALLEEAKLVPDLHIMADPFHLEQAFRNLFENSLSACRGEAYVHVEFDEVQYEARRALRVRVRDNGPGLSPEAKVHLFEPFFTTKAEGTGLGTAIVHRIVTAHHGRVDLEEQDGPGTAFRIILPREE